LPFRKGQALPPGSAKFPSVTLLALQEGAPTLTPAKQAQLRGTSASCLRYTPYQKDFLNLEKSI